MEYSKAVCAAARVVLDAMPPMFDNQDAGYSGRVLPAELVAAALALPAPQKTAAGPTPKDLMDLWNAHADERLPRCRALTAARQRAARARLREWPDDKHWRGFIAAINRDEWALGLRNNPKYPGWKADFDWFIKPASIVRFIEGRFGGKSSAAPAQSARETYSEDIDRR